MPSPILEAGDMVVIRALFELVLWWEVLKNEHT